MFLLKGIFAILLFEAIKLVIPKHNSIKQTGNGMAHEVSS